MALEMGGGSMSRAISTSILFAIMAEVKEVAIIFDVSDTNTLFIEKKNPRRNDNEDKEAPRERNRGR